MRTPPKTLNGYPVIAKSQLDDEAWVIICYREGHSAHEYVVAKWSIHSPNEWIQGHYFETILNAAKDFSSMKKGF